MRFRTKVFFALFASSAVLLMALSLSVEELLRHALEEQYLEHYGSVAQLVGDTLRQMESATARIASGTAQTLYDLTLSGRLPSEDELKKMKNKIQISQLVLTGHDGTILRDTETPPEKRTMKIFDFCAGYRQLLDDPGRIETTPILPSFPSGNAYMFSMMSNAKRTGIVEAGVHVGFIVDTLLKAIQSDHNLLSIGLYTPKGVPLGFQSKDGSATEPLSDLAPGTYWRGTDRLAIVTKVPALVTQCCECAQKKLVQADGQYYYFLRTDVALAPLYANEALLRRRALMILGAALLLAFALSRWASSVLVRRISRIRDGVREIMNSGNLNRRLALPGHDEIAELGATFDELTAKLESTQQAAIQTERNRALAEIARQVAHDIRSPLAALKSVTQSISVADESERKLVRTATNRIHEIAEKLLARHREGRDPAARGEEAQESLMQVAEAAIAEKRAELGDERLSLELRAEPGSYGLFTGVAGSDLKRVLSNLLNNAAEAIDGSGRVTVTVASAGGEATLAIEDDGKGIPPERLPNLMQAGETFGKKTGTGLGLAHARETIQGAGGRIAIQSELGHGTRVEIRLPGKAPPAWFPMEITCDPAGAVVILDDDQSVHRIWKARFAAGGVELLHCFGIDELVKQKERLTGPCLFLVDQEIAGADETGLAVIERLGIQSRSVLVTSHADDAALAKRCLELGLKLLPKSLAGEVPLRWTPRS